MDTTAPPRLTVPEVGRRRIPIWLWALIPVGLVGLGLLRELEPAGQWFYPRCWVYETLGLQCATCGATRALHALMNGQWAEAVRHNVLVVATVPVLIGLGVRGLRGWWTGRWWPQPLTHPWMAGTLVGLFVGITLGRNLPL